MKDRRWEPMCATSEKGERLIDRQEMLPISLEIGKRILEVFGNQQISNIVFRLRSNHDEIDSVINGDSLPSTELLLGIHKLTGVSIDWLLTGIGTRYLNMPEFDDSRLPNVKPRVWFAGEEREPIL